MKGIAEGTLRHRVMEGAKRAAFRMPLLNGLSRPVYPYKIEPIQLAALVSACEQTRGNARPGHIVEVGVARGMTTVFLLEHLRAQGDSRPYVCLDTFSGFLDSDIAYEVRHRGKQARFFGGFSYNDAAVFAANMRRNGYDNARIIEADAGRFDFARLAPIDVMLLDVDLYKPTAAALRHAWPHLNERALVMVDDCSPGGIYDGANQAYHEFCAEKGIAPRILGNKAGLLGVGIGGLPG